MPLSIVIKKTGINSEGTIITIKDDTGNYHATDNPGGYGTPNPDREDLALFLRAYGKRYNKTETLESTLLSISPDNDDKTVASEWEVTILSKDSWILATIYGLKLYDENISIEVGELCYHPGTAQIRKIATRTGSGPYLYTYTVVDESDLETETNIKAYQTIYNTYAIPTLCECHSKANKYWQKTKADEDWNRFLKLDAILKAIKYDFGFGSYSEGQKNIEWAEDICNCIEQECNC